MSTKQFHRKESYLLAVPLVGSTPLDKDIDLSDISRMNLFLRQTYPNGTDATTTGVQVDLLLGMVKGPAETDVEFGQNVTNITSIVNPATSAAADTFTISQWNVGVDIASRLLRVRITLLDPTKNVVLNLMGDVS